MLGRMEVTAQRIEAREASSRVDEVEQTATYALLPLAVTPRRGMRTVRLDARLLCCPSHT